MGKVHEKANLKTHKTVFYKIDKGIFINSVTEI